MNKNIIILQSRKIVALGLLALSIIASSCDKDSEPEEVFRVEGKWVLKNDSTTINFNPDSTYQCETFVQILQPVPVYIGILPTFKTVPVTLSGKWERMEDKIIFLSEAIHFPEDSGIGTGVPNGSLFGYTGETVIGDITFENLGSDSEPLFGEISYKPRLWHIIKLTKNELVVSHKDIVMYYYRNEK
ncbi:MAG: hypothetical protein LBP72_11050 [Dysgonamonadaceae bacterium]|jgi:hypothetical protein|nr:hypothetical protein [Dysgonamonadaceae bacterium]